MELALGGGWKKRPEAFACPARPVGVTAVNAIGAKQLQATEVSQFGEG